MISRDFSALDHIHDPIIVLDSNDRIVFLNKHARRMNHLFYDAAGPGSSFVDVVAPDRRPIVKETLQQIKLLLKPLTKEVEYPDINGRLVNIEVTYNPVVNDEGKLQLVYMIVREISNERIFQKRASQLGQDLSSLVENANAIIFTIDSSHYITEWNKECARVTGLEKEHVLAQPVDTVIGDGSKGDFAVYLKDIFEGYPTEHVELQLNTSAGEPIIVLLNATPKINSAGVLIGALFVGHDITELYQYRLSLERMVKENTKKLTLSLEKERELVDIKNRFVSMASHEFRIPLSNIVASAKFIRENAVPNDSVVDKIVSIESQVGHMRVLIDDVLTIGKAEASKLKAVVRHLDLISFIERISEEVRVGAQYSHNVKIQRSSATLEIESDEKLLRNIFINVLSNAIKFSPGKESVFVRVEDKHPFVEIEIMDEGIGISAAEVQGIFEPFNRGSNVSEIKGTGLGLSIVKRAVETLGGQITIESAIQAGTKITITLNRNIG